MESAPSEPQRSRADGLGALFPKNECSRSRSEPPFVPEKCALVLEMISVVLGFPHSCDDIQAVYILNVNVTVNQITMPHSCPCSHVTVQLSKIFIL